MVRREEVSGFGDLKETGLLESLDPLPVGEPEREGMQSFAELAQVHAGKLGQVGLAATAATLRRMAAPPAISPTFEQRFYARLTAEKLTRRRSVAERLGLRWTGAWRWLAPGLAGAAAAAVVLVYTGGQRRADEAFLAMHLDLFESYDEVANLDAIESPEDVQLVAHLHELRRKR